MNKQNASKIDLLLMGLEGRFSDNKDFFICMTMEFKSGNKVYTATVKSDDKLKFSFGGNSYSLSFSEFRQFVSKQIPEFDTFTLRYNERGSVITVFSDGKNVSSRSEATAQEAIEQPMGDRDYYIRPERASELLRVLGIIGANGKVLNDKIRKYNQIDHFVELLDSQLRKLCAGKDEINVIDCGCGKSYLSFVLNYYIREVLGSKCYFTGVDYNQTVINDSIEMADRLGYRNMRFVCSDIKEFSSLRKFDLLLTLHACDTATDMALSYAIKHNIENIVCVPCCHKELNGSYKMDGYERILQYGILKARIADSLTDGLRGLYLSAQGYSVSMKEYISPLDTPKNLMICAVKDKEKNEQLLNDYKSICKELGKEISISKL